MLHSHIPWIAAIVVWAGTVYAQEADPQTLPAGETVSSDSSTATVASLTHARSRVADPIPAERPLPTVPRLASTLEAEVAPLFDPAAGEHPLMPALRKARERFADLESITDYSATLVKRERIGDRLTGYQYLFVKVRHEPFSVYIHFLAPSLLKGQQCIYVEGENGGKMWARGAGLFAKAGTLAMLPDNPLAMRGSRYPLTEIGVVNLVNRLVQVAEEDLAYGECDVKFVKGALINKRPCTVIQVVHPVPRRNFRFHVARIFIDDKMNVPVRYESYDWPESPGKAPRLLEEYTYVDVKLNQGFTDLDFSRRNTSYGLQ